MDQIKAVLSEDFKETTEQIYDIYLLPPGEDPETCQSYLRMRNKEGKYCLMFEVCLSSLVSMFLFQIPKSCFIWTFGCAFNM